MDTGLIFPGLLKGDEMTKYSMHGALLDLRLCSKNVSQENPRTAFNGEFKESKNALVRQSRSCKAYFQEKSLAYL
jgi:hypothetical protein